MKVSRFDPVNFVTVSRIPSLLRLAAICWVRGARGTALNLCRICCRVLAVRLHLVTVERIDA